MKFNSNMAKALSKKSSKKIEKSFSKYVIKEIKHTAKSGETFVVLGVSPFTQEYQNKLIAELQSLGYSAEIRHGAYYETRIMVSWE